MRGTSLTQYLIIIALVALFLVPIFYTFGGTICTNFYNMLNLYTDVSDTAKTNTTTTVASGDPSSTPSVINTLSIAGYEVDFKSDGSASFTVEGQNVTLPLELIQYQEMMVETTGASALDELVAEVAYMIVDHKDEYPDQPVPLEIAFGTSERQSGTLSILGDAEVNAASIKVGEHFVILQQDHQCLQDGGECTGKDLNGAGFRDIMMGSNRIEGDIVSDSLFNLTSVTGDGYSVPVDDTSSVNSLDTTSGVGLSMEFDSVLWNIDFEDPDKVFAL